MTINLRELLSTSAVEGEKVRLLVIGSPTGVTEVIHTLHSLGYAEARAWSQIMPIPEEPRFMSILPRQRRSS